jgi:TRAP-type C4-dicarboxylate transport system substrate-binding protein
MKKTKFFKSITILGLTFLVLIALFGDVQAKTITLVFSTHDPQGGSWAATYEPFFAAVEKRTNGNIKIEPHWGGELVGLFDAYAAAADGTVDIAHIMPTINPGKVPLEDIQAFNSYDRFVYGRSQQFWELHKTIPEINEAFKETRVLFKLATFPNFLTLIKGKQINRLEDCKGLKFLATGKWDARRFEALGMVPMSMMPEETFMALQTGVMEGATLTYPSLYDFGWGEVIKNIVLLNVRPAVWAAVMNINTWNKIPTEYQKIIEEECEKMPAKQDAIQMKMFRELGVKFKKDHPDANIIEISKEEQLRFINADKPVWKEYIKELDTMGLSGEKIIDTYLKLEKKYSSKEYEKYAE